MPKNRTDQLSIVLAPYYAIGAPGHYQTFPDAFIRALHDKGPAFIAHPNSDEIKLGGAFHDPSHPILTPGFYFRLTRLVRKLRPKVVFLQSIDCKLGALPFLHLAALVLGAKLKISGALFESSKELEQSLRSCTRLRALAKCQPISCSSEEQIRVLASHGLVGELIRDFSTFDCGMERSPSRKHHGKVRIVARGGELLRSLISRQVKLCAKCTYEVHPPEEFAMIELPPGMNRTNRALRGQEYFEDVLKLRHHVFLYDEIFDVASARVNDSMIAGVPCAVPSGGQLEQQILRYGNGLIFDVKDPPFESLLNHPTFDDVKEKVMSVGQFMDEQLKVNGTSKRAAGTWIALYCLVETCRFVLVGANRVLLRAINRSTIRAPKLEGRHG